MSSIAVQAIQRCFILHSVLPGAVERLLYHMLKDDALNTRPAVADEIRYSSLSALSYGFYAYFDVSFHIMHCVVD